MTTATALGTAAALRFRDVNGRVVTPAGWLGLLNEVYTAVNTKTPLWPWLDSDEQSVTLPAATRGVALPDGVFQVNWVYDTTSDRKLVPNEGRGAQFSGPTLRSQTGDAPITYRVRDNTLEVYPLQNGACALKYEAVVVPSALTGSDAPIWGVGWDDLLINGMLAKAYLDDGQQQQAAAYQAIFEQRLVAMEAFYLAFRTETYPPIRDTFWSL